MIKSHFYAYISKIRWLQRWGLKRNTVPENVMEHSWEVSVIAHALAIIRNKHFDGDVDVNAVVVAALYHDCGEVITGDMPSPIKYHSKEITSAYKKIERQAEQELLNLLPEELREEFSPVMLASQIPAEHHRIIKAADTISAFLKCQMELSAGNLEFSKAADAIRGRLEKIEMPEVNYFMTTFSPSYSLTLDELMGGETQLS